MGELPADQETILRQLEHVLASSAFRRADRSTALLRFLVQQTLEGHADRLKEYTLGAEALGRGDSFDPRTDPVVRAEASRLRTRLAQYYGTSGRRDPIHITLPKGSYVPQFLPRPDEAATPTEPGGRYRSGILRVANSPRIAWACAVVAGLLAVMGWFDTGSTQPPLQPAQFEIELKSDGVLASDIGTTVVVSPDGTRMVFVSRRNDGRTQLNLRRLDHPDSTRLAGTEGARAPFISFDGRWVGFWAEGKLKKVALAGGAPVVLCDATDLLGASWGEDDTIIAAIGSPGQLSRIPAAGGTPVIAIDLTAESAIVRWPQLLPGGESVIYTVMTGTGADRANIEVQSTRGGSRKVLVQGATFGRYLDSGYLAYVNQGTLYAMRFDPLTLTAAGPPVPLLEDVAYSPLFGYAELDLSRTGMLVYRKGAEGRPSVINWIDRSGNLTSLLSTPGGYGWIRLSPNGQHLAFTTHQSGIASISVYDVKTGETTRVTPQSGEYTGLTWLPGGFLAFGGATGLGFVNANKPGDPVPLTTARIAQTPWSITADGQRLAYYQRSAETGFDLWTVPVHRIGDRVGVGQPEQFLSTRHFEVYPSFSPDGQWVAYASNESGIWEIYVRRFSGADTKVRVSTSGGVIPRWSPNARELLYRTSGQQVMVMSYDIVDGSFIPNTPRPWSKHTLTETGVFPNFDISPSGEEVLALMSGTEAPTANQVTVWLNFNQVIQRLESR